jgi:hypothetical protein
VKGQGIGGIPLSQAPEKVDTYIKTGMMLLLNFDLPGTFCTRKKHNQKFF